jgi:hypothetical protein
LDKFSSHTHIRHPIYSLHLCADCKYSIINNKKAYIDSKLIMFSSIGQLIIWNYYLRRFNFHMASISVAFCRVSISCSFSLQKNYKFITFYVTLNVLISVSLRFINCIANVAPNYDKVTVNNEARRI